MAEQRLWFKIRNKQTGYKFRRQHSIGNYIVDFYCPALKIIIEIDGYSHTEKGEEEKDKIRQKYLESLGFKVIRYTNGEIMESLEGVVGNINEICEETEKINKPHLNPPLV